MVAESKATIALRRTLAEKMTSAKLEQLTSLRILQTAWSKANYVGPRGAEWQNFSRNGKILLPLKYERRSAKLHTLAQQPSPQTNVTTEIWSVPPMPGDSLALEMA